MSERDGLNVKKRFHICIPVPWKICGFIGLLLLCLGYLYSYGGPVSNAEENDSAEGYFSENRFNNSYTRVNKNLAGNLLMNKVFHYLAGTLLTMVSHL